MPKTVTLKANFSSNKNKLINEKKEVDNPFELMITKHGNLIVNKYDELSPFWGVGSQIMRRGYYDMPEIELTKNVLKQCKTHFGDGVVALDCGANIGVHTIEWSQLMDGWGKIYSFEAQKFIYYSLCGSIALNSCFNVDAKNIALGNKNGSISVPKLDYRKNTSFGSLEIKERTNGEWIGQNIDYSNTYDVELRTIDSFNYSRVDFIKVDVEGMEEDVFMGALDTIKKYSPVIFFEHSKSDKQTLENVLINMDYYIQYKGNNALAIHKNSPITINLSDFDL